MQHERKRIGILTSGGDCAGLNAAIRAIVSRAVRTYGWDVFGIREGTRGLMSRPIRAVKLDLDTYTDQLLRQGGTVLGAVSTGDPFNYPMPDGTFKDRTEDIVEGYQDLGLSAIIGIGGDGSMYILNRLAQTGSIKFVGIPKTIDNDLALTECSIGFTTAVNVAVEALDRLQATAASHDRVMILEVMGRDAGHIALYSGIAGGADVILMPEIPYRLENVVAKIAELKESRHNHALVVAAEAVKTEDGESVQMTTTTGEMRYGGIGHYLGEKIAELTGAETRVTVLGHVQRGGTPSMRDRLIASAFGVYAVDLVAQGSYNRMVTWQHNQVVVVPVEEAIQHYNTVSSDDTLVRTARGLGICLGD